MAGYLPYTRGIRNFSLEGVQGPTPRSLMPPFVGSKTDLAEENYANNVRCDDLVYCPGQPGGMVEFHQYLDFNNEKVCKYCGCRKSMDGGRRRRRRTHHKRTHKRRASRRNRRTARR